MENQEMDKQIPSLTLDPFGSAAAQAAPEQEIPAQTEAEPVEMDSTLTEEEKKEFITNIKNDSIWLLNMVENLLSETRIHDDKSTGKKDTGSDGGKD